MGGSETVTVVANRDPKDTAASIEKALGGQPDASIDCSCTRPGIATAIYVSHPQYFSQDEVIQV